MGDFRNPAGFDNHQVVQPADFLGLEIHRAAQYLPQEKLVL